MEGSGKIDALLEKKLNEIHSEVNALTLGYSNLGKEGQTSRAFGLT